MRPKFLADEVDLVPRKAVVAIVAHQDMSRSKMIASSLSDDPMIRAVTFVTNSSMKTAGQTKYTRLCRINLLCGCDLLQAKLQTL